MTNERLIANAGSGKTYALTTRMIRLLHQDVEPRRIAALTFTRKSAGEFLAAVFERLAKAALDAAELDQLRRDHKDLDAIDADRCRELLGKLANQLGCLGMGTIDSLFARIARAFPLESGLAEDFSMAGEAEIQAAHERTLAALFANESRDSLADFLELLRRVNRNCGERDVFQNLLSESQKLHGKFLATPPGASWGDAGVIWGAAGCEILNAGPISKAVDDFLDAVLQTHPSFSSEAEAILRSKLQLLRGIVAGRSWNKEITDFVKSRLSAEPSSGSFRITPKKDGWLSLNPSVKAARRALLHAVLKPEFETLLLRSRSLHALIQKFEKIYTEQVRSAGFVTFADITDSLARRAGDGLWRDVAGYRIDQKFDHWLLDEFQDTSRPQWKILKTFIDEVVMDSEQRRSFFYVGDTKQAIYSWRGGDPDLFQEIFEDYNKNEPAILDAAPLDKSYRSCREILDFVNQVFSDLTPVKAVLQIPDGTIEKWQKAWQTHAISPATQKLKGYAEWIPVPKNEGDDEDEGDAQERKVLEILEKTKAWQRGLSCAVLKRNNKGVESLAALLQSKGIPVAIEGKTNPCVDNPLGAAILAALRLCASPDDKLSEAVLRGFPVAQTWGIGTAWEFRNQTLAKLAQEGFAVTIRGWVNASPLDDEPFLQERAAAFLVAAEEFDVCRKSSDGIPDFLRFVEARHTQENEASRVVRIMTVHQSKGLGFDMVIVSGLDQRNRGHDGIRLALGPEAKEVQWGVELPSKEFAQHDDVFRRLVEIEAVDEKFAEICTAYVALTRPKKALYVITTKLKDDSDAKNFARHLSLKFADTPSQFGDENWFNEYNLEEDLPSGAVAKAEFHSPLQGTPKPASPSSFKTQAGERTGFVSLSQDAADLGTEIHEALAGIDWFESSVRLPMSISAQAGKLIHGFLEKPIAKAVFTQPDQPHELWRERAFDVLIDGQWISGIFDRVLVYRSAQGAPSSAVIYDFKTDYGTADEIEKRYAGQMAIYRKAAAQLLSLDEACVTSEILRIR